MRMHLALVALSLALGSGTCGATSIKWVRDVVVSFSPGSAAPDSGTADELRKLMEVAGESCSSNGIEVIALDEIMLEVPRGAGAKPTPRTSELRRLLQELGAPATRIYEGAASIAEPPWQRVMGPPARPDTVEVQLVCTPGR